MCVCTYIYIHSGTDSKNMNPPNKNHPHDTERLRAKGCSLGVQGVKLAALWLKRRSLFMWGCSEAIELLFCFLFFFGSFLRTLYPKNPKPKLNLNLRPIPLKPTLNRSLELPPPPPMSVFEPVCLPASQMLPSIGVPVLNLPGSGLADYLWAQRSPKSFLS